MSYVAPLTYGVLVAHFIPGFIMYLGLWFLGWHTLFHNFLLFSEKSWLPFVLISIVLCFTLGLLIDGIRSYLVDNFLWWIAENSEDYKKPEGLFQSIRSEFSLQLLDYILEKYYRFYQLYANTFVALFVLFFLWTVNTALNSYTNTESSLSLSNSILVIIILFLLALGMFFSARKELRNSIGSLKEFMDGQTTTSGNALTNNSTGQTTGGSLPPKNYE